MKTRRTPCSSTPAPFATKPSEAPNAGEGFIDPFADIDADIYVLVDGDGTYDPTAVGDLIARLIEDDLDMVCGARVSTSLTATTRNRSSRHLPGPLTHRK